MSSPPWSESDPTRTAGPPSNVELDDEQIETGRYAVLEVVGRGGMGTVFRAYDPKLRREVALKRLHPRRSDAEATARMIREARAMAQLSHSNVVAVFDVEAADGSVLIAMEYVQGQTLRAWLATQPSRAEILDAFTLAGRGLAAAHAAGLVHRDFKPTNVLIGEGGAVKVTDFGLAKPIDAKESADEPGRNLESLDLADTVTSERSVMGTPRYMAPEQHRGDAAGPRSDQYAFCVALWEALLGEAPFRRKPGHDLLDAKLAGPPTPPSGRSVPKRTLEALTRGLAPQPEDRFEDVPALLEAIRPRAGGRGRRAGALALAAAAAAAVYGLSARDRPCEAGKSRLSQDWNDDLRGAARAGLSRAAVFADAAWPRIESALDAYAADWIAKYDDACAATHIRRAQSSEVLDMRTACLERHRRALATTIALFADADRAVAERGVDAVAQLPPLSRCDDVDALKLDVPPPDSAGVGAAVQTARLELSDVDALFVVRKYDEAAQLLDTLRARSSSLEYAPLEIQLELRRGRLAARRGDTDEAVAVLTDTLTAALERRMWPTAVRASAELCAVFFDEEPRLGEARWLCSIALAHARQVDEGGRLEATALRARAGLAHRGGEFDEAIEATNQMLEIHRRLDGDSSPSVAADRRRLSLLYSRRGDYVRAEAQLRDALAITEQLRGEAHPLVRETVQTYGILRARMGQPQAAIELFERAVEISTALDGLDHPQTAMARINLATALKNTDRFDEAGEQLRAARATLERTFGPKHYRVAEVLAALGALSGAQDRRRESLELYEAALEIYVATLGPDHADIAIFRYNVAEQARRLGQWQRARDEFEESLRIRTTFGAPPELRADTARRLAEALDALGEDPDRVRELARSAIELYRSAQIDRSEHAIEVETWLAERGG